MKSPEEVTQECVEFYTNTMPLITLTEAILRAIRLRDEEYAAQKVYEENQYPMYGSGD
jgi:hypothetical protein